MILFFLQESRQIVRQVVTYNTAITWIVAVFTVIWLAVFFIQKYRRVKSFQRLPKSKDYKLLKKIIKIKNELSAIWLRKGESKKIHAIGIGKLESGEFCIQIFINDSNEKMFESPQSDQIPNVYKGIPLVLFAMPQASFLAQENYFADFSAEEYKNLIRGEQSVITGGISGANSNLNGEVGTIGYFVRRKSFFQRKSEIYLLSNSHVFADLRKEIVDEHDLILQPSPGESANSRPIAELTHFAHPKLENDTTDANFVDAAIAKLWKQQTHKTLIPMIGAIKGFAKKEAVEIGEKSRKFGRTTGYTAGKIFSIYLDIWIKYDRTGQSSFFKNQFLIEPETKSYEKFVEKGDSGSLLVDGENYATGLIFAGANGNLKLGEQTQSSPDEAQLIKTINNFGVANPISDVLTKLKIELDI
jgi:hypothetical protein